MGKAITYAAGNCAEIVMWMMARTRNEHRQTIEWLDRHTNNDFSFFLAEIEL